MFGYIKNNFLTAKICSSPEIDFSGDSVSKETFAFNE